MAQDEAEQPDGHPVSEPSAAEVRELRRMQREGQHLLSQMQTSLPDPATLDAARYALAVAEDAQEQIDQVHTLSDVAADAASQVGSLRAATLGLDQADELGLVSPVATLAQRRQTALETIHAELTGDVEPDDEDDDDPFLRAAGARSYVLGNAFDRLNSMGKMTDLNQSVAGIAAAAMGNVGWNHASALGFPDSSMLGARSALLAAAEASSSLTTLPASVLGVSLAEIPNILGKGFTDTLANTVRASIPSADVLAAGSFATRLADIGSMIAKDSGVSIAAGLGVDTSFATGGLEAATAVLTGTTFSSITASVVEQAGGALLNFPVGVAVTGLSDHPWQSSLSSTLGEFSRILAGSTAVHDAATALMAGAGVAAFANPLASVAEQLGSGLYDRPALRDFLRPIPDIGRPLTRPAPRQRTPKRETITPEPNEAQIAAEVMAALADEALLLDFAREHHIDVYADASYRFVRARSMMLGYALWSGVKVVDRGAAAVQDFREKPVVKRWTAPVVAAVLIALYHADPDLFAQVVEKFERGKDIYDRLNILE